MPIPNPVNIFHILHIDKLCSVLSRGCVFSDRDVERCGLNNVGTKIGMESIKESRRSKIMNPPYADLCVGSCTPFYFCPRSVMLFMFFRNNNPNISYKGGQTPILHLVADFHETIEWASINSKRWAFTQTNAAGNYAQFFNEVNLLSQIDWSVIHSNDWKEKREYKQAEFLIEEKFPFSLVKKIGVHSVNYKTQVDTILRKHSIDIDVCVENSWYY